MVVDATGAAHQVTHYGPYGETLNISPSITGTQTESPYKFSGKEWDSDATSYAFGARHYSPTIPFWTSVDPLAEKYYSLSPYAYCAGNPVNLVDPEGLSWFFDNETGAFYYHIDDDNDNIYLITQEQFNSANQYTRVSKMERVLQSFEKDENLLGAIFMGSNDSSLDLVFGGVLGYFYSLANQTEENGGDVFFEGDVKQWTNKKDSKSANYTFATNQSNIEEVFYHLLPYKGYYIINLLAHEIYHQMDVSKGNKYPGSKDPVKSAFMELMADEFACSHWSYRKSVDAQKDIEDHIQQQLDKLDKRHY